MLTHIYLASIIISLTPFKLFSLEGPDELGPVSTLLHSLIPLSLYHPYLHAQVSLYFVLFGIPLPSPTSPSWFLFFSQLVIMLSKISQIQEDTNTVYFLLQVKGRFKMI